MGRAAADNRSKSDRIAELNAATPRAGSAILQLFELFACNESLSLGVPKGVFSFAKENIPFDPAARRRHFSRTCANKRESFFEKENLPLDNIDIR
jgi:hypothetical protein